MNLAEKIYADLNKRGADLGNASIGIIEKTLTGQIASHDLQNAISRISELKRYTYWPEQGCTGSNAFVQYETGEWMKAEDVEKILGDNNNEQANKKQLLLDYEKFGCTDEYWKQEGEKFANNQIDSFLNQE
ncbi:MAG: hypothetical protein JXR54_10080 [Tannerellaceae bacterium]|nr:hypothetical protein [Tannerellaceae bacterium]